MFLYLKMYLLATSCSGIWLGKLVRDM